MNSPRKEKKNKHEFQKNIPISFPSSNYNARESEAPYKCFSSPPIVYRGLSPQNQLRFQTFIDRDVELINPSLKKGLRE